MSTSRQRVEKIRLSLTPRQTVILWMEEAHRFPTMHEYVKWLRSQPEIPPNA